MRRLEDLIVLGVGGKISRARPWLGGPTGASGGGSSALPASARRAYERLEAGDGNDCRRRADRKASNSCPTPNLLYLPAEVRHPGEEPRTWAMNTPGGHGLRAVPGEPDRRYSTGNVYPLVPVDPAEGERDESRLAASGCSRTSGRAPVWHCCGSTTPWSSATAFWWTLARRRGRR